MRHDYMGDEEHEYHLNVSENYREGDETKDRGGVSMTAMTGHLATYHHTPSSRWSWRTLKSGQNIMGRIHEVHLEEHGKEDPIVRRQVTVDMPASVTLTFDVGTSPRDPSSSLSVSHVGAGVDMRGARCQCPGPSPERAVSCDNHTTEGSLYCSSCANAFTGCFVELLRELTRLQDKDG